MLDSRKATAAAVFYPAAREELARTVHDLLETALAAASPVRASRVKAIIVPHGRFVASGAIAAAAWALLTTQRSRIRRVIVLGPAHHMPFAGIAAPAYEAFETPLGAVGVDRIAIETARRFPQVFVNDFPHEEEHSVEVQLPFLQTVLDPTPIVPLLVGDATDAEVAEVLESVWNDGTLVVVSTDLSEYYDAGTAARLDQATANAVEALRPDGIVTERACGGAAVRGLLRVARSRSLRATRLALEHAPTLGVDPSDAPSEVEVCGFGAFAFG